MKEDSDGCPTLASLCTGPHTHLCVPPPKRGIWGKRENGEGRGRRNINLLGEEKEIVAEKGTEEEAQRPNLCGKNTQWPQRAFYELSLRTQETSLHCVSQVKNEEQYLQKSVNQ